MFTFKYCSFHFIHQGDCDGFSFPYTSWFYRGLLSVNKNKASVIKDFDNIQEHLENPFDQVGEDDIRINPDKFIETLNE
ncbi:MAG: hypothetical protein HQ517_02610 [SAR324 cluster bacterium]|nr:hypothetical protein [SAR324 cluster bacterium]